MSVIHSSPSQPDAWLELVITVSDGSISTRTDIETALRFWALLTNMVHSIIFDLRGGPLNDFGVEAFLSEAAHGRHLLCPSRRTQGGP